MRLGAIPTTKQWQAIVDSAASAEWQSDLRAVKGLASQVLELSKGALQADTSRAAITEVMRLLIDLGLSAEQGAWQERLGDAGNAFAKADSPIDVTVTFHETLDRRLEKAALQTDIAELAQKAAGEALSGLLWGNTGGLFEKATPVTQLRDLSTPSGFGEIAQGVFAGIVRHHLGFYLSRVLPGAAREQGASVAALIRFNDQLSLHAHESSAIVRTFAKEWFSKAKYEKRLSPADINGFVSHSLTKLSDELSRQGDRQ